jgi:hypothetical protein
MAAQSAPCTSADLPDTLPITFDHLDDRGGRADGVARDPSDAV